MPPTPLVSVPHRVETFNLLVVDLFAITKTSKSADDEGEHSLTVSSTVQEWLLWTVTSTAREARIVPRTIQDHYMGDQEPPAGTETELIGPLVRNGAAELLSCASQRLGVHYGRNFREACGRGCEF